MFKGADVQRGRWKAAAGPKGIKGGRAEGVVISCSGTMHPDRPLKAKLLLESVSFQHSMLVTWDKTLMNYLNISEVKLEEIKQDLREMLSDGGSLAMLESAFETIQAQFSLVYEEKRIHLQSLFDNMEALLLHIDPVQAQPSLVHLQDLRCTNPLHPRVCPGTTFQVLRDLSYCQDAFQQLAMHLVGSLSELEHVVEQQRDGLQTYYGNGCLFNLLPCFTWFLSFLSTLKEGVKTEMGTLKSHLDSLFQGIADLNKPV